MDFSGGVVVDYESIILLLNEAGLMFKGHTDQGEVDFILLEIYDKEQHISGCEYIRNAFR